MSAAFGPWRQTEFYANWGLGFHSNSGLGVVLQGGIGALLALAVLALAYAAVTASWGAGIQALLDGGSLEFLPPRLGAYVVGGGMAVGGLGGLTAARHAG